jgi:hypothetical protein
LNFFLFFGVGKLILEGLFITGVNDTGKTFIDSVIDTGEQFRAFWLFLNGINYTGDKLLASVNTTADNIFFGNKVY